MPFETPEPGMFVVTYRVASDLTPSEQGPLIAAVEAALREGPVAILFDVGAAVKTVDLTVPTFWLEVTGRLPLAAIGIVAGSIGVRIAGRGFKIAQNVRKHPIAVEVFENLDEGVSWVFSRLVSHRASLSPSGT